MCPRLTVPLAPVLLHRVSLTVSSTAVPGYAREGIGVWKVIEVS